MDPLSMLGLEAARALLLQGTGWTLFVLSLAVSAYLYKDRNKIIAERLADNQRNIQALERVAASNGTVAISVESSNKIQAEFTKLLTASTLRHEGDDGLIKDRLGEVLRLLRREPAQLPATDDLPRLTLPQIEGDA